MGSLTSLSCVFRVYLTARMRSGLWYLGFFVAGVGRSRVLIVGGPASLIFHLIGLHVVSV